MKFHRMLLSGTGRTFLQDNAGEDVHSQYGIVTGSEIDGAMDGEIVTSSKGEKFVVVSPSFIDRYKRIKRGAQIITFKDAGIILTTAGLGPESVVAEAGSGSGALTVLLARHCKHVYSYDISEEHLETAKKNVDDLGLQNVTFAKHDITTGVLDGPVDCLVLDMPEPWHTFEHLENVNVGGYVVAYVPSTVQLQSTMKAAEKAGLLPLRTVEVTERHWMVKDEAVRPTSRNVAFTAFLSFFRYLGPNWPSIRPPERQRSDGPALPSEELMQELF